MTVGSLNLIDDEDYEKLVTDMDDRERIMLLTLDLFAEAGPEATGKSFETIKTFYTWFRSSAAVVLEVENKHPRREPLTPQNNCNCRLRAALMLLESLPDPETESKGELIRLYDQALRGVKEAVTREIAALNQA